MTTNPQLYNYTTCIKGAQISRWRSKWRYFCILFTIGAITVLLFEIGRDGNLFKNIKRIYIRESKGILDLKSMNYPEETIEEVESTMRRVFPQKINSDGIFLNHEMEGEKVAIIVPYRERYSQLVTFLRHMHPFLLNQRNNYRIFIVNQSDNVPFNRASLLNIGYIESQKYDNYKCFVFSDIDLLPENLLHTYNCDHSPEHLSKNIDTMNYRLPYSTIIGGAVAVSKAHFQLVNGFSNFFWGWGGEDDDFSMRYPISSNWIFSSFEKIRIRSKNLEIFRKNDSIARYKMNKHAHVRSNSDVNKNRFLLLDKSKVLNYVSGINNTKYNITQTAINALFISISVDLTKSYQEFLSAVDILENQK